MGSTGPVITTVDGDEADGNSSIVDHHKKVTMIEHLQNKITRTMELIKDEQNLKEGKKLNEHSIFHPNCMGSISGLFSYCLPRCLGLLNIF